MQVLFMLCINCRNSFLGEFAKLRKATISVILPVLRPHGTTRLPLDGYSSKFTFEDFSKTRRGNSSVVKIGQE